MNKDLHLTGTQYNIALTVFFFPYALLEVPSNMVLKVVRPSVWIAVMMLAWGTVMALMGIVKNHSELTGARTAVGRSGPCEFAVLTSNKRYSSAQQKPDFSLPAHIS